VNELVTKLAAQIEDINAKQSAALAAAEADGVSDDDRTKHLAEFDKLQGQKEKAQSSLKRAELLHRDQLAADAPRINPVVQEVFAGGHDPVADRITVPARARRHGPLVAYKGREKDAYMAGVWLAGALCAHPSDFERAMAYRQKARQMGLDFIEDPAAAGPQANLTGLSNQQGGFFVPDVIETTVIELALQYGVLRQFAEVVPMTSDSQTSPRWSTAMKAYWIARGQKPTSSDPAWNAVQLIAQDMGAMTKIGRQLNEDAIIDLGEKVTVNVARAFSLAEDDAGFNGDGTSTYGGRVGVITRLGETANAASVVTATGHATVPALTNADFLAVTGAAPNYKGADWRWYCHKQVWAQSMAALQLAGGGNRVETIAAGGQMAYLGYPVEFVNVMPKTPGTGTIAVVFADLRMSVKVGDRRGRTIQAGYENDDFTRQLMTILGTQRVDINVHTVIDPLGDANAPGGPIMGLKLG